MPRMRFNAGKIVVLLRQIEVLKSKGDDYRDSFSNKLRDKRFT